MVVALAGTIQVVVPNDKVEPFVERIESLLGTGACMLVKLGAPGHRVESAAA